MLPPVPNATVCKKPNWFSTSVHQCSERQAGKQLFVLFCCPVNFPKAQAVKRNNDFLTVPLFLPKPNLLFLLFPSIFSRRRLKKNKAFHDFLFIEKKFRQNNFKCSHSQAGTQTDDFFFGFFPEVFPKHGLEKTNSELCFFDFSLSISELHRTPEPFVGCKTESSFVKRLCFYCFVLGRQTARQQGSGVYKAQMFCPCFRSFRTGRLPKKNCDSTIFV